MNFFYVRLWVRSYFLRHFVEWDLKGIRLKVLKAPKSLKRFL